MAKVVLVATLTAPLSSDLHEIRKLPDAVTCLQVRADLIGDVPVSRLRSHFSGELLYTLRGSRSGWSFYGPPLERQQRILSAAQDYDLVELEADSDLSSTLLAAITASRRLISWSGAAGGCADLHC